MQTGKKPTPGFNQLIKMDICCSVIIINYNTADLTLQAIASVLHHAGGTGIEIIVVDNASTAADLKVLENGIKNLNQVYLCRSKINLGFGGGNMLGVQKARGKYYVFLNSDTYLMEDSIEIGRDFLNKNPDCAVVGFRSINEDGYSFKNFSYTLSFWQELFGDQVARLASFNKFPSRKADLTTPTEVGSVQGSFLMVRAVDFNAIGGFDTNLFLYYEELDLSYRIKKKLGKTTYYLPQTTYVHLRGKSTPPSYPIKKELRISQFYTVRKNLGLFQYLLFYIGNFIKYLFKAPFSAKNRRYLALLLKGVPLSESLRHKQVIRNLPGQ